MLLLLLIIVVPADTAINIVIIECNRAKITDERLKHSILGCDSLRVARGGGGGEAVSREKKVECGG